MKRHFWIGTVVPLTKESEQSNLPHRSKLPHFMVFRTKNVLGSVNKTKYFYVHIFIISNYDRNFGVTLIDFLKLRKLLFREA